MSRHSSIRLLTRRDHRHTVMRTFVGSTARESSRCRSSTSTPTGPCPPTPHPRRSPARVYAATRSLPLVCMHGHVDAALLADDMPFGDPAGAAGRAGPLRDPDAAPQGVPLEALGVAPDDADAEPTRGRSGGRSARNWHLFRGTPSRYWLEHELVEVFGVDIAPSAETADEHLRPDRRPPRPARVPAAGAVRPLRHRGARHHRRPAATTSPQHARLAADRVAGRVVPTFRPDALVHLGRPSWRRRHRRARRSAPTSTPTTTTATSRRCGAPPGVHRAGAARHRPRSGPPTPPRCATPRRAASTPRPSPARSTAPRRRRSPATCCSRWRRCPARTAWSCRCTPACCATTTASRDRYGADQRLRHPRRRRVHPGAAAAARGVRPAPRLPAHPVHRRRDRLLPRARAARRRLPGRAARRAVVVPGQPGRHAPVPRPR